MKLCRRDLLSAALALGVGVAPRPVLAASGAPIHALVIGVGRYAAITDPKRELRGTGEDVRLMRLLLLSCGATETSVRVLQNEAAINSAVRAALAQVAKAALADADCSDVVFYFSGRGATDAQKNASIAPANATLKDSLTDIPLADIAAWARDLEAKNKRVTVILDAAFGGGANRAEQNRIHNPEPKTMARKNAPLAAVINWSQDAGVLFCAASGGGQAFEWKADTGTARWNSIFTDLFVNGAFGLLQRAGDVPTGDAAMNLVRRYFADRPNYLSGIRLYPPDAVPDGAYNRPLFGVTPATLALVVERQKAARLALQNEGRERQARAQSLRVVVSGTGDTPSPFEMTARETLTAAFGTGDNACVAPAFAGDGDRIVRILSPETGATGGRVEVTGSEFEADKQNAEQLVWAFGSPDELKAVLTGSVATHLKVQALVKKLFWAPVAENSPLLDCDLLFRASDPKGRTGTARRQALERGTKLQIRVAVKKPGIVLMMDGAGYPNGVAQLFLPAQQAVPTPVSRETGENTRIFDEQGDGAYRLRVLFFAPPAPDLARWTKALTPNGDKAFTDGNNKPTGWKTLADWNRALLPFLAEIQNQLADPQTVAASSIEYTVRGSLAV